MWVAQCRNFNHFLSKIEITFGVDVFLFPPNAVGVDVEDDVPGEAAARAHKMQNLKKRKKMKKNYTTLKTKTFDLPCCSS